ncbi:MAG: hypothetical protein QM680_04550 [Luteolibacter sp.]
MLTTPLTEEEQATQRWILEAEAMVFNNQNHRFVSTYNQIRQRGRSYNEAENRRELERSICSSLSLGGNPIKPESFTWYHRESYQQSIQWRQRLLELVN